MNTKADLAQGKALPTPRARAVAAARRLLLRRGERPRGALFADEHDTSAMVDGPDVASFAELSALYPQWLAGPARKRTGSWFTKDELAGPTAARAIEPLAALRRPLRIVDPACGGGAFLLAALRARVRMGARPAEVVADELFGVDVDATAAQLAAWTLHEACFEDAPPIEAIEAHVHAGCGLRAFEEGTFDAVVGNPPWETLQRGQGLAATADATSERSTLRSEFQLAGRGKLYTYRLFVERALRLLVRGGRLGLLVPASLYFDRDARALRDHLLDECRLEWLFGFENRRRLFAIDSRYRFCAIVAETGSRSSEVRVAFARTDPAEWSEANPAHLLVTPSDVRLLSPASGAFVESRCERDLMLLRAITARGTPLLGERGVCQWRQGDFNMTSDRARFVERSAAERDGFGRTDVGTWQRSDGTVLLPLVQGAMLDVLHPNAGAFAGGSGHGVRWSAPRDESVQQPQFLVDVRSVPSALPPRVALRALSNATNARSAIACLLDGVPCGNSLGVLWPKEATATPLRTTAFVAGVLGSLTYDWALRQRLAGTNLNGFVLTDTVLPRTNVRCEGEIAAIALRLCAILPWHGPLWSRARAEGFVDAAAAPAITADERSQLRLRLELLVARAFDLSRADLEWMLRDCDLSAERLRDRTVTAELDPRGFWRVDRDLAPELRLPVRVLREARTEL